MGAILLVWVTFLLKHKFVKLKLPLKNLNKKLYNNQKRLPLGVFGTNYVLNTSSQIKP